MDQPVNTFELKKILDHIEALDPEDFKRKSANNIPFLDILSEFILGKFLSRFEDGMGILDLTKITETKDDSLLSATIHLNDYVMSYLKDRIGIEEPKRLKDQIMLGMLAGYCNVVQRAHEQDPLDKKSWEIKVNSQRFTRWSEFSIANILNKKDQDNYINSETSFKGIDLRSTGHKYLCEKFEKEKIMFFFEAPCILPGDSKRYRRMDLIAVKGNRVVIVEIDGEWHANEKQRRDDYERDRLVGMHWQNRCRLTHAEVTKNPSESFSKIMSHLDPSTGITQ
tara:strand:+ start:118 stop:960 length:843 start_codon:yes stop_codon:yes gene_type:complete